MMPRNSAELLVPAGTFQMSDVKCASPGAWLIAILIATIAATTMISSTVTPSVLKSTAPARLAGVIAKNRARPKATAPTRKPDHHGWSFQMPITSRNDAPKIPAAVDVTRP